MDEPFLCYYCKEPIEDTDTAHTAIEDELSFCHPDCCLCQRDMDVFLDIIERKLNLEIGDDWAIISDEEFEMRTKALEKKPPRKHG